MNRFKRTVSALALGLALAGGVVLVPSMLAPAAMAQDPASPEGRLTAALEMQGIPAGVVNWASVEDNGSGGIVARGVYADVTQFNLGFNTIPLGDLEVSDLQTDGKYVTRFTGRFTGVSINLAELMTTGQKIGQAGGNNAMVGTMLTMMAGYIQGLGYQTLDMTMDFDNAIDLGAGTYSQTGSLDLKDAFKFDIDVDMTGITAAYLDWVRENGIKLYLNPTPESQAEVQKQMTDPNGPIAGVGFERFAIVFDDQGLMPKLEPQLAMVRQQMLAGKTEMTDEDIKKAAAEMAGSSGLSADKLEPVVRALYNFVMKPDVIRLAATLDPALTQGELMNLSNPAAPKPETPVDWNARVTLEASN